MFRLLVDKKQLEQKQVADYAMVPIRDARELLYRMLRAGYLSLQARHNSLHTHMHVFVQGHCGSFAM